MDLQRLQAYEMGGTVVDYVADFRIAALQYFGGLLHQSNDRRLSMQLDYFIKQQLRRVEALQSYRAYSPLALQHNWFQYMP